MNPKVYFFIFSLLTLGQTSSWHRYNNRVIKIHEPIRQHEHIQPAELKEEPSGCDKFGMCQNAPDYHENEVRRLVDNHKMVHSFLRGNVIEPAGDITINSRTQGTEEVSLCKTVDIVAAPRFMMDVYKTPRHIVNVKNYTQILKYQTCDLDTNCSNEVPLDTVTKCVQQFNNIKLMVVDVKQGLLEYSTFHIPSTCVCTYMRNF